ncbi:MAG TPA: Ig domain-containing protein [Terracidiphilus sp.]|nr:Ig domain-containing protein [Terracidiphilus sp.]
MRSSLPCLALLLLVPVAGCVSKEAAHAPKLSITTGSLPSGSVGTAYSTQIAVAGGTAPFTYTAAGLPAALTMDTAAGTIAGTPAQSAIGTAQVTVTVTDTSSPQQTATATYSLTIAPATLTILTTALPDAIVGSPYTANIGISGGTGPFTYAASGLPTGLAINATTGALTGTPVQSDIGTAQVTFTVTDSGTPTPQKATATISITTHPGALSITNTALPAATVGVTYNTTITATGGIPPYSFSASGLPSSLSINATTGAVTGTPLQADAGNHVVTFTVTDSTTPAPQSAFAELNLTVNAAAPQAACSVMDTGDNADMHGFVPFPADNPWNTDISAAPVDPNSGTITSSTEFAGQHLHHDFSSVAGGDYGIPYTVVDSSTQALTPISVVDYASESDVALAPYPATAPIEGSPTDCDGWPDTYVGDAHVLVIDRNTCTLYETFNTHRCTGQWSASSETIWDLKNDELRPYGWTSADAAGLAIFPGLVRYDEVASGVIRHAIRFTMPHTMSSANGGYFVSPASHAAGNSSTTANVMGMRIRLKASFDISGFSPTNQVILTAMKKYGMILADNGSAFYFQGVPDARWNDADLANLDAISSDNFDVVQMSPSYPGYDAVSAPTGSLPIIDSFTPSSTSVAAGTAVTLNWTTTNDTYDFIDQLGGVHGNSVTVTPTATTTYILYATNQYGRTQQAVTVTVH